MRTTDRRNPHAIAWGIALSIPLGVVTAAFGQMPNYEGELCPTDDGTRLRFEVTTDPDVTLVIIYPTPPGGGWHLEQEAPGQWIREFDRQGADDVTFNLLMQNPQQFVFPEHTLSVANGCVTFERDDVTPPHPRGFRHSLEITEGGVQVVFEAGAPNVAIPEIGSVALVYRVGAEELQRRELIRTNNYIFKTDLDDVSLGDSVEYFFQYQVGIQNVDTTRFNRIIGDGPILEPEYPIEVRSAARFRDRHANEWRFDHYVADYGGGKFYEMIITDHGRSLDIKVIPDEESQVSRMDFKYYTQNNPETMCDRHLTVQNLIMEKNGNEFTSRVSDASFGQIIDFEFTFVELQCCDGITYYSDFHYYHVGSGEMGTRTSNPRAYAAGDLSVSEVTDPRFGFAQHGQNLTIDELDTFFRGKERFETDHLDGELKNFQTWFDCCSENPIGVIFPPSPHARTQQLGPMFSAQSCISCHHIDGRGATPTGLEDNLQSLTMHLSIPGSDANGKPTPHPLYGQTFSTQAVPGETPEGRLTVSYEMIEGAFADGTPYVLRKPTYSFHDTSQGSLGSNLPDSSGTPGYEGIAYASPRIAPILAGVGLLDAVSDQEILRREDPFDSDGDGISGRANWVWDELTNQVVIGRFGWKANQPNLEQQTALAYQLDLGMTSPMFPQHDCGDAQESCDDSSTTPELNSEDVTLVAEYLRGLSLPPRNNYEDPEAYIGMQLFREANCQACHVPTLQTASNHPIAALANQEIQPFTDLLLHDMGPDLADGRPDFEASGREWRTAPLWGAEYVPHVLGVPDTCSEPYSGGATPNYLHDGRATSLMEAILWHGGEAAAARDAVLAMDADERRALLKYVAYPFADPYLETPNEESCIGDINGDGAVDGSDLTQLLDQWGSSGPTADLDMSGIVNGADLTILLARWGQCP